MSSEGNIEIILDMLHLEMLHLIEQLTICRIGIEKLSNGGQLLLAKTRYLQGTQTVSVAQIPTENSEFQALCRVVHEPSESNFSKMESTLHRADINKEQGLVAPLHWFGVLTPSSLRAAAEQFKKCIELVVESTNLQRELTAVMDKIEVLRKIEQPTLQ